MNITKTILISFIPLISILMEVSSLWAIYPQNFSKIDKNKINNRKNENAYSKQDLKTILKDERAKNNNTVRQKLSRAPVKYEHYQRARPNGKVNYLTAVQQKNRTDSQSSNFRESGKTQQKKAAVGYALFGLIITFTVIILSYFFYKKRQERRNSVKINTD